MNLQWNQQHYLYYITKKTKVYNLDNITRTKAYQNFYLNFPEIKWAFLASIVSRNAGWNMTDLFLPPYKKILNKEERMRLFMTYERANWLIFSDAYPQLLLYKLSLQKGEPMFHLLSHLNVSRFMVEEWTSFWKTRNKERLMIALIINEQHVIQNPVIKQSYFKYHVFLRLPYLLQNFLFMNAVLLPTRSSTIYGQFVHGFTKVANRITLGKQIASMIYHPHIYHKLLDFALTVEHTGSRRDYEQFLDIHLPKSPFLRLSYPVITHHDTIRIDWYKREGGKVNWFRPVLLNSEMEIGSSYYKKRNLLYAYYHIKRMFT